MKSVILILTLLLSTSVFSKGKKQHVMTAKQLSKMSIHKVHLLRNSMIKFLAQVEEHDKKHYDTKNFSQKTTSINHLQRYLQHIQKYYQAHASDRHELVCFYGGWPSIATGSVCEPPWDHVNDDRLSSFNPKYTKEQGCGSADEFRCNPVLFGAPAADSAQAVDGLNTQVNLNAPNPEAGFCINLRVGNGFDTYRIAKRCNEVSQHRVEDLAEAIKSDSNKQAAFLDFYNKILGPEGFCNEEANDQFFITVSGKEHPACRDLERRLAELNIRPLEVEEGEEEIAPISVIEPEGAPEGNIGKAIMDKCADQISERDRDSYNRNFAGYFSDGLYQCLGDETAGQASAVRTNPFDEDMENIARELDKREYLKELNEINFSQNLDTLLINEYVYNDLNGVRGSGLSGVMDSNGNIRKDVLMSELAEEFPHLELGSEERQAELEALVDNAIERFNQNKAAYPKLDNQYYNSIRESARELQNLCNQLKNQFDQEFPESGFLSRFSDSENARNDLWGLSDNAESFIEQSRRNVYGQIENFLVRTGTAPMMGTESFIENGIDPEVDYAKECATGEIPFIMDPNVTDRELAASINQSKDMVVGQLSEINRKEAGINNSYNPPPDPTQNVSRMVGGLGYTPTISTFSFENEIEDYLKNDRSLLLTSLLNTGDEQEIQRRAYYICSQIDEEYTKDWWRRKTSILAFAGTSVAALGACVFSAGIGCPAAFAGAGLVAGAVGIGSGTANYMDGRRRIDRANQNMASGQTTISQTIQDNMAGSSQATEGLIEGGFGVVSMIPGLSTAVRAARAGRAGTAGTALLPRAPGGSGGALVSTMTANADEITASMNNMMRGSNFSMRGNVLYEGSRRVGIVRSEALANGVRGLGIYDDAGRAIGGINSVGEMRIDAVLRGTLTSNGFVNGAATTGNTAANGSQSLLRLGSGGSLVDDVGTRVGTLPDEALTGINEVVETGYTVTDDVLEFAGTRVGNINDAGTVVNSTGQAVARVGDGGELVVRGQVVGVMSEQGFIWSSSGRNQLVRHFAAREGLDIAAVVPVQGSTQTIGRVSLEGLGGTLRSPQFIVLGSQMASEELQESNARTTEDTEENRSAVSSVREAMADQTRVYRVSSMENGGSITEVGREFIAAASGIAVLPETAVAGSGRGLTTEQISQRVQGMSRVEARAAIISILGSDRSINWERPEYVNFVRQDLYGHFDMSEGAVGSITGLSELIGENESVYNAIEQTVRGQGDIVSQLFERALQAE